MKVEPVVGGVYRQEFSLGEAEDMAEVAACSEECLVTREFLTN